MILSKVTQIVYKGKPVKVYDYFTWYNEDDLVIFNDIIYKCLVPHSRKPPYYNQFYWDKIEKNEVNDVSIKDWEKDKLYTRYDKVKYKGSIYVCEANRLNGSTPPPESLWWKMWGNVNDDLDKKPTTIKVNNDRVGDITADNVVIYGNHTGNISANGEKSVVVVFGDVTGDITANQVIRLDKQNIMKTIKTPELPIGQEY